MRLHYLQHVEFEDAANIASWAEQRGHRVTCTRLDLGQKPPSLDAFDLLAVMGGPMNIHEEALYPWLVEEKQFLRACLDAGRAILGVCLGAQLLADILGGPVRRNAQREIGWFPVRLTPEGRDGSLLQCLPPEFMAMHWHGDTFAIPPGAIRLAESDACANQAFQYGDRVLGLQFHLDYTADSIEKMLHHCGEELTDAPFVQNASAIRDGFASLEQTQAMLYRVLDDWIATVGIG